MKSDINGISTCKIGEQKSERFINRGKAYYQYKARAINCELFTCVKSSLESCVIALNKWLSEKQERNP